MPRGIIYLIFHSHSEISSPEVFQTLFRRLFSCLFRISGTLQTYQTQPHSCVREYEVSISTNIWSTFFSPRTSTSKIRLFMCIVNLVNTSFKHACGSYPFSLAGCIKFITAAVLWPSRSEPANNQLLLYIANDGHLNILTYGQFKPHHLN